MQSGQILQGGQRLEKPWKTLKSLEFVTGALKTLKNCLFKKKTWKTWICFKKTLECVYFHIFWFFYDLAWGYFSTSTRTFFPTRSAVCKMVRSILKNPACVFVKGPWKWCKALWKIVQKSGEKPGKAWNFVFENHWPPFINRTKNTVLRFFFC